MSLAPTATDGLPIEVVREFGNRLARIPSGDPDLPFLKARLHRLLGAFQEARALLETAPSTPPIGLERLRLAMEMEDWKQAEAALEWLRHGGHSSSEIDWLRGWFEHRQGRDDQAARIWTASLERFAREKDFFARLTFFTLIRQNWDLPDNVDQVP